MKAGDLIRWVGRTSAKFPGPRMGIILCTEKNPVHGSSFWNILFEGKTVWMDETYWEVIRESG